MKITQIRNATLIIEYENIRFLIDPWLMPKDYMEGFDSALNSQIRQPRVNLPFEIEKIVDVNAVIITHIHPDHWDEFAEKSLDKNVKIFVQSETDKNYILSKGFKNVEILLQEGNKYQNITLYKTKTQHGKKEILKPLCESIGMPYDAMGVVFQAEQEPTLYVAGDTIFCPELCRALDTYRPTVVVVNACGARVATGDRLIMAQEDVKQVAEYAPQAIIVASHMDTVSHLTVTREDLRQFAEAKLLSQVKIPADGETYETVLGTGAYKAGIHLPEGVYRAELLAGSGSVSISDRENSIYIHNYFGTEEEYDEVAEMDDLRLYNGADLDVGGGVLIRLTTDNAQPLTAEPYPAESTDTYSLPEGEYRAGTGASEIPEGIYDISIAEDETDPFGYASITLLYPNGLSGYYWADSPALATDAEGYTSAGVKNVVIPDGTEISITYGDIVLTPGQACYDVDYTDYPQP